jgi:hypothetical protein
MRSRSSASLPVHDWKVDVRCTTSAQRMTGQYRLRSELKIFNLTERIEKQKENCHEHILRMTTDRLPKYY